MKLLYPLEYPKEFKTVFEEECIKNSIGKKIKHVHSNDDFVRLIFEDHKNLTFRVDEQSCCEHRYLTYDDDLDSFIGSEFLGAYVLIIPEMFEMEGGDDDPHEMMFFEIKTSLGVISITSHNQHNGYYGGVGIRVS